MMSGVRGCGGVWGGVVGVVVMESDKWLYLQDHNILYPRGQILYIKTQYSDKL